MLIPVYISFRIATLEAIENAGKLKVVSLHHMTSHVQTYNDGGVRLCAPRSTTGRCAHALSCWMAHEVSLIKNWPSPYSLLAPPESSLPRAPPALPSDSVISLTSGGSRDTEPARSKQDVAKHQARSCDYK